MARILVGLVLAWILVGCGGGEPVPKEAGDLCATFGDSFCSRADSCGLLQESVTACVNDFYAGCCGNDGTCNNSVKPIDQGDWNQCLDDIDQEACGDVANGDLPTSCLQL